MWIVNTGHLALRGSITSASAFTRLPATQLRDGQFSAVASIAKSTGNCSRASSPASASSPCWPPHLVVCHPRSQVALIWKVHCLRQNFNIDRRCNNLVTLCWIVANFCFFSCCFDFHMVHWHVSSKRITFRSLSSPSVPTMSNAGKSWAVASASLHILTRVCSYYTSVTYVFTTILLFLPPWWIDEVLALISGDQSASQWQMFYRMNLTPTRLVRLLLTIVCLLSWSVGEWEGMWQVVADSVKSKLEKRIRPYNFHHTWRHMWTS